MKPDSIRRRLVLGSASLLLALGLGSQAVAGENLLAQIKHRGTLTVGLEGTYPPFSFQDQNGALAGFEVDFSQALAKQLGVKLKLQPTKWDGILAALESKRIDMVINQVTITPVRQAKYDFSTPYTISGIQALTRKGEDQRFQKPQNLVGKKVGVGLGTIYEQWLKANVKGAEVRTYDDDPTKHQDLNAGRIDAILIDRLAAFDLVNKSKGSLVVAGRPFAELDSGIAMRKGNPELVKAVNQAIGHLRQDGTLAKISQKWFKADVTK
jgi:cystine transport system substrate-binding protein